LRVSTSDQDLDKNKSDILFFANENNLGKVHFVEEKISGAIHWKKRELGSIINSLVAGDDLIVSEFSRLGRSMLECMEIMTHCLDQKIGMAQKPPVLVNIMHAAFYPNVLPFRHECYDSIAL